MNDINFIKNLNVRNRKKFNKELKIIGLFLLVFLMLIISINLWQFYRLHFLNINLIQAKKDIEILDSVIAENNFIKDEINKFKHQIFESEEIVKTNNKILDLVISIANIIPEDSYLNTLSYKPILKLGLDLPNMINAINSPEPQDKEYGFGKVRLKGFTTSKSITEFLERLSRLEIVDNVRLIYLKYPENLTVANGSSEPGNESNLLEFSIKLLLNGS